MTGSRRPPSPGARNGGARGGSSRAKAKPRSTSSAPRTQVRTQPRSPVTPAAVVARERPRLTGRMAVLAVVFAVLVVSYASSLRAYLEQRSHIASLTAEIASSQGDIAVLEREKKRWKDNSYVADQARARFGWVLPGEVAYQVIGADGKPLTSTDRLTDPAQVVRTVPTPWWEKQYTSLQAADHPPKAPPAPAGSIKPDKQ